MNNTAHKTILKSIVTTGIMCHVNYVPCVQVPYVQVTGKGGMLAPLS